MGQLRTVRVRTTPTTLYYEQNIVLSQVVRCFPTLMVIDRNCITVSYIRDQNYILNLVNVPNYNALQTKYTYFLGFRAIFIEFRK